MRKVRRTRREGQGTELIAADLDVLPIDAATVDSKVALIHAPLGLLHVEASLQQELEWLTGPRYARHGGQPGLVRYGRQLGSVYLADQKLPIQVPRCVLTLPPGRAIRSLRIACRPAPAGLSACGEDM